MQQPVALAFVLFVVGKKKARRERWVGSGEGGDVAGAGGFPA